MIGKLQTEFLTKQYELAVALMEPIIRACQQLFCSSTKEQQVVTPVPGNTVELCKVYLLQ